MEIKKLSLDDIERLIGMIESSDLDEIMLKDGVGVIRLRKSARGGAPMMMTQAPMAAGVATSPSAAAHSAAAPVELEPEVVSGHPVESPTVGTYYSRPGPESEQFVSIGDAVAVGDTLCVVEAMKTFNEIQADAAGVVVAMMKDDGDPVEFGETLFVIG